MKITQNARHFAARKALEIPGLRTVAKRGLVDLHVRIFADKADEDRRDERRDHLQDLFDATMDSYLAALQAGFSEAEAREITHIQANVDFALKGWVEMIEYPIEEMREHYERYEAFFERHGITLEDPLGTFRPADGIADAPATPERLSNPEYENAVGGFADDVYVDGEAVDPDEVDPSDAPGVSRGGTD